MISTYKIITEGLISELTLTGSSMIPTFKNGAKLSIVPISNSISIGSIYLFNYRSKLITHRLLKINGNNCIFIGDNTSFVNQIDRNKILGKIDYTENRLYQSLVILINSLFYNSKKRSVRFNKIRTSLIKIAYLLTHRRRYERKI